MDYVQTAYMVAARLYAANRYNTSTFDELAEKVLTSMLESKRMVERKCL